MLIIKPYIFNQYPEITFGFSTKIGLERTTPYYFNMSYEVGDDDNLVTDNREKFFNFIGLESSVIAYQQQVHGNNIAVVNSSGSSGKSDALITTSKNLGIAISSADCCAIFIYDPFNEVLAGVHSGWRGTQKEILVKVLQKLSNDFDSNPGDLVCYLGPAISQINYEVGKEVAENFDPEYLIPDGEKYLLNIPRINFDILINFGVFEHKIQVSGLCSYEYKSLLHSYRRNGEKSGRALGVIAMRDLN